MKKMSNTELFSSQQKKIQNQNQEIEEIVGQAKVGKEMAIEIRDDLGKQNKLLDEVGNDVG